MSPWNNSKDAKNKGKGIDTSCQNSKREAVLCTICYERWPAPNHMMKRGGCGHMYCKECILNYGRERIKETLTEFKCPVSDCNEKIVIDEFFVPSEFLEHWRDTVREAQALASCYVIECPFMDCSGYLMDDKKGYLIRTCPKCWTIFCVRCRDHWHMGMDCAAYQLRRKITSLSSNFLLGDEKAYE